MYYATFNTAGILIGRYSTDTHAATGIPTNAIEIPQALYFQTIRENDGVWMLVKGSVVKRPNESAAPDLPALIATERYRREASGVGVGALLIETTRDSQALIASTGLSAILNSNYRCNFKTAKGFVELGSVEIIEIAQAVRSHVQACFDRELMLLKAVEGGTYRDEMLTEGWPQTRPEPAQTPPQ